MVHVAVVEDHDIVRASLAALLDKHKDLTVVWTAASGREALQLAENALPDVLLMDVVMPDLGGVETTRLLLKQHAGLKVLALTGHPEKALVAEMLSAGASGYLMKGNSVDELLDAIRTLADGGLYLGQGVTGEVVRDYVERLRQGLIPVDHDLSPREREVLQLIAEGRSTKEIAGMLHVSVQTVASHRQRVMEKTRSESIAELTKYAIRRGFTPLGA